MHRVPVFKTVLGAYAFVWQARKDFVSLAIPLVVVLATVWAFYSWLWPPLFPSTPEEIEAAMAKGWGGTTLGSLLANLVSWAVYVMFAVAWHRRYLVPAEATTVGAALRWRWRQTRFLLLSILVFLIAGLIYGVGIIVALVLATFLVPNESQLIVSYAIYGFLVVVAALLALPVYGRLTMWLPSTAVDHRMSLRECWAFSRGNGWRLGVIFFIAAIPIAIPVGLIALFSFGIVFRTGLGGSLTMQLILALVQNGIGFIGTAAGVSALSIAYRQLMAAGRGAPPAAGA